MHLSLFSDLYLADSFDHVATPAASASTAHRDGILRGLAVMAIAGVLIGLTMMSAAFHAAQAGPAACDPEAWQAPQAAVWWEASGSFYRSDDAMRRSTSLAQPGTAVTLVALRQRFRSACR